MQESTKIINNFTTQMRQLIMKMKELKKENGELYDMVQQRDNQISELKEQLSQQTDKYNALMMAKMINITDGDIESSKRRIYKLIRSVNQCIALLSGKEDYDEEEL